MKLLFRLIGNFIILYAVIILCNQYAFSGPYTRMVRTNNSIVITDPCVFKIGFLCKPEQKWKFYPNQSWNGWSHEEYK